MKKETIGVRVFYTLRRCVRVIDLLSYCVVMYFHKSSMTIST